MTPDEYRNTIAALDLSQAGAARLLGVDERTSRRWALGERAIPGPAVRLLELALILTFPKKQRECAIEAMFGVKLSQRPK